MKVTIKNCFKEKFFDQLTPEQKMGYDMGHYDAETLKKIDVNDILVLLVCKTAAPCVDGYEVLNISPRYESPQLIGLIYDYQLAVAFCDLTLKILSALPPSKINDNSLSS